MKNKGWLMLENVNKNETIDYDILKKEALKNLNDDRVDLALNAAEYYIYEAVTWPFLARGQEAIMQDALLYNETKEASVDTDDEVPIKLTEDILGDMCKKDKIFEDGVQTYLKSRKDLFDLAKHIYEYILESSVSDKYKKQASDALKRYFV